MRTLLVGIDAACGSVLDPLLADGALPNLGRVFEGSAGPLESQLPPWTASAWPSLYTGTNPGKHGVFDFLAFDGYDWDLVNATRVRRRTVWELADHHGLSSVVVNAPVTHPPRAFDGALIPGYLAPETPTCHPEGILADVREAIGDYRVYARRETDESRADEAKFEEYLDLTRQRGAAFRHLADRFDPDFGFVQFQKTDAVFHDFPGDEGKVRAIYEAVDEEVGAIREACEPATVIVASDHGIGPYGGYEFRINEYLRERGFVETTREGRSVPSWFRIKDEELVESGDESGASPAVERAAALAARFGLTYQRGKAILERVGLAEFVGRHVPVGAVFAASERVDHAASAAYLRSPSELGVRLNVAGREPEGVVPADEYDDARGAVMEALRAARTPDGDPVFERVLPREEVFEGPCAEDGVDVVTVPTDFEHALSAHVGEPFGAPETYNHKLGGIVAASGAGVDSGAGVGDAHLFDVAPTVLATLGVPPAAGMDGEPLPFVDDAPPPESYPEFDPGAAASTDDAAVEERLADLGYLE